MEDNLKIVRIVADYQFGRGVGKVLFPESCRFILSPSSGRIRQVIDANGARIVTMKADSGWFTLGIEGAKKLHAFFEYPKLRVVVLNEVAKFIAEGGNAFAKHIVDADKNIRANDEVIVVDENDNLLATGKCILSAFEMLEMKRGVAVSVRQGIKSKQS